MKFESIKVLEKMKAIYELPKNRERFDKYLLLLQGTEKKEMILPIVLFNPMGKELAVAKLNKLLELEAETILEEILTDFNKKESVKRIEYHTNKVAVNLIDDIEGSWSNLYATDYKSKFEIASTLKRDFSIAVFWTSEIITKEKVIRRIKEYLYRTIYWIENGEPNTLNDLLEQEIAVQLNFDNEKSSWKSIDIASTEFFFESNKSAESYSIKVNFFYGDKGSSHLNYATYGIEENSGFIYAKYISEKRKARKA